MVVMDAVSASKFRLSWAFLNFSGALIFQRISNSAVRLPKVQKHTNRVPTRNALQTQTGAHTKIYTRSYIRKSAVVGACLILIPAINLARWGAFKEGGRHCNRHCANETGPDSDLAGMMLK